MQDHITYFTKDNGRKVPVSDRYLTPFLSPTTKGTHFRESAPESEITDRQQGRVLLQIHQILGLLHQFGVDVKGKSMMDIGTGNGLIPRLMLELSELSSAVGVDPYLDAEHMTAWQPHDHDEALAQVRKFIDNHFPDGLDFERYKHLLQYENFSMRPMRVPLKRQPSKKFRFEQLGAHDLGKIDQKFDLFYCKAIEHIHDWPGVFKSIAEASNAGGVIYLKHRSFFSYLGPHRYSTINIPWGHLLLTDSEWDRFVAEQFPEHAPKMREFYYEGLTYPRATVSDMIRIARDAGFVPISVIAEPPRYLDEAARKIEDVPGFWEMVRENHPGVPAEEVLSGMYHIVLRKFR